MSKYLWPVSMLEDYKVPGDILVFFQGLVEDSNEKSEQLEELYIEHELLKDTSSKQERYIVELEKQIGLLQKTLDLVDKNKPRFIVRPGKVSQEDLAAVQNGPVILHTDDCSIVPINQQQWIPVTERLPESGVHVLVACEMYGQYLHGQYVCDGFYADRYTQKVENIDYDIACEYCEEDDEYYLWQGWYEVIKNWDDYNSVVIGDTVTHWMPLPEPPKGE